MSGSCNCNGEKYSKTGKALSCYQSGQGSLLQKVTFEQRPLGNEGSRHSGEWGKYISGKRNKCQSPVVKVHLACRGTVEASRLEHSGRHRMVGDEVGEVVGAGNAESK